MRKLELLAPARDAETARAAILCGADAVYIGGPHHGARASAANSIEDIKALVDFAHRYRVRVYVTLNTLVYDSEIAAVERTVRELYAAQVDALIVQDLGTLRMNIPPIALHASTQCDARTPAKARFLQDAGMSCIVLPREMTLDEIREVSAKVSVPLEAFVHGALCVCYSGDCRASLMNGGRSANRGECAQICRVPFDLTDGDGNVLIANRHLLSLRDLNRIGHLADLADAGISSFKIEGRLKSPDYVMNTVAAYSAALDALCVSRPDEYCRASCGVSDPGFHPDLDKTFNRSYTTYFTTTTRPAAHSLAQHRTPKWTGFPVGIVRATLPRRLTLSLSSGVTLGNGDGLGYFDAAGQFRGFRANKVEEVQQGLWSVNVLDADILPAKGTKIYRNTDAAFDATIRAARPSRTIGVEATLEAHPVPGAEDKVRISLSLSDVRGCSCSASIDTDRIEARSPQREARLKTLSRLGDTIYTLRYLEDNLGDIFIPASTLTTLRRRATDLLTHTAAATYPLQLRDLRKSDKDASALQSAGSDYPPRHLTFHENVANRLAEDFYRSHGVETIEYAAEVVPPSSAEPMRVMTTRYCLRRELGACLRTPDGCRLPFSLVLRPVNPRLRPMQVDFDCAECRMHLSILPASKQQ